MVLDMEENTNKCHIGAEVECDLRSRIVAIAKAKDMSLSAVIRQALKQYADREGADSGQ